MRRKYVIGNWKMYKTSREAIDYIEHLTPLVKDCDVNVYLSVPYTAIPATSNFAKDTNIVIGAQNMNDAREGAFTGEIAGLMLKEAGASFVLLGHSERRKIFGETNAVINKKVIRALKDGIWPVLCVGETVEERDSGMTEEVLREQISLGLSEITKDDVKNLIVAYEPVWAIGTGRSADNLVISQTHKFCRDVLKELFGRSSSKIPVLYGGSVNLENVQQIAALKNVDGVLVGGASLDPQRFASIVLAFNKSKEEFEENSSTTDEEGN